jgi:hypothetical protein
MRSIFAWPRSWKSRFSNAVMPSSSRGETLGRSPSGAGAAHAASTAATGYSRNRFIVASSQRLIAGPR